MSSSMTLDDDSIGVKIVEIEGGLWFASMMMQRLEEKVKDENDSPLSGSEAKSSCVKPMKMDAASDEEQNGSKDCKAL